MTIQVSAGEVSVIKGSNVCTYCFRIFMYEREVYVLPPLDHVTMCTKSL